MLDLLSIRRGTHLLLLPRLLLTLKLGLISSSNIRIEKDVPVFCKI